MKERFFNRRIIPVYASFNCHARTIEYHYFDFKSVRPMRIIDDIYVFHAFLLGQFRFAVNENKNSIMSKRDLKLLLNDLLQLQRDA